MKQEAFDMAELLTTQAIYPWCYPVNVDFPSHCLWVILLTSARWRVKMKLPLGPTLGTPRSLGGRISKALVGILKTLQLSPQALHTSPPPSRFICGRGKSKNLTEVNTFYFRVPVYWARFQETHRSAKVDEAADLSPGAARAAGSWGSVWERSHSICILSFYV